MRTPNVYGRPLIQHIDELLLNVPVKNIVQCIDPYRLTENILKLCADLRHRKGDDRKAPLLAYDILVRDLC